MEDRVMFLPTIERFNNIALIRIENTICEKIFISGIWNRDTYEGIIQTITKKNYAKKCKILVPNMKLDRVLPMPLINQINKQGGQIRINSQFNNNLLIIDNDVFILSFSFKYGRDNNIKVYFECGMFVNEPGIVNEVKNNFLAMWDKGLQLVSE